MNKILKDGLRTDASMVVSALSLESQSLEIDNTIAELNAAYSRFAAVTDIRNQLIKKGGISRGFVMESYELAPMVLNEPLTSYTLSVSQENYAISLEAVEGEQNSLLQRIKALIKKIVDFAVNIFNRIKDYVLNFISSEQQNKRSLNETQLLLNQAKAKANGESVAQEGYATGTIPLTAPKFLHIEYTKIIAETGKLEALAGSYIKDTLALLSLQFMHCKHVIEAYNKLMMSTEATSLSDFDNTCQNVVRTGEARVKEFHSNLKVFNCIEIVEDIRDNEFAGVLKYRASIKAPSKEDLAAEHIHVTTNLMKAQDLQDRLTALNDEIVKYAKEISTFFSGNSKIFLETLNKLNDSATKSTDGKFTAHSDYIVQVHNFLVRGNLIQVVMGLNVLNTVWKQVHSLNTRVVKEFLSS